MPTKTASDGKRRRCAMACENCKRRKERCDGNVPCRRCAARHLTAECHYSKPRRGLYLRREPTIQLRSPLESSTDTVTDSPASTNRQGPNQSENSVSDLDTTFPYVFRLVHDDQRGSVFFGDSANESFLQQIRQLVARTLGSCPFVDQPVQYHTNNDDSISLSTSLEDIPKPPAKPSPAQAKFLVSWSMRATNGLLGVFYEVDVQNEMAQWLEQRDDMTSLSTAICYLVFANGARSCPEDQDAIADIYFAYARYLTNLRSSEEPNLKSIICHSWIAFYHLLAGRRDAAYQSVGVACRGACAMGIHRGNQSFMNYDNCSIRDRLWKALRMFDTFTSGSLGRPICTTETRNTKVEQGYSSIIDITSILDAVLREFHEPSTFSKNFIENMTQEHRLWAARMSCGLELDGIESAELVDGCECVPSLAFSNVQESYYWSIMLLTRPVLLERASTQATGVGLSESLYRDQEVPPDSDSDTALVYAAVDSAVRTIRLLQSLLSRADLPKRLPFPVNSAFTAALTLVVATFADLDRVFPLRPNLKTAEKFLQRLEKHDSIARYYRHVVQQLQFTCDKYIEQRNNRIMEKQNHLIGGLFGRLHDKPPLSKDRFDRINVGSVAEPAIAQESLSRSPVDSLSTICLTDDLLLGLDPANVSDNFLDLPFDVSKESQMIDTFYVGNILDNVQLEAR
ncbi:hypothetical protein FLONG3_522 [Fusarium longipes]|uniref:Zn(2)-C6 fungal-type domain-containing protein n=1 Tax=Fusarium longipes TaxID=694270 RepID=A0A395T9L1_9HYPO|nr:hypothetical protein FLONG3_522 [Fusarium longipes]